jgi:hypothetical protein
MDNTNGSEEREPCAHGITLTSWRLSEKGTGPLNSRRKSLFLGANSRVLSPFRIASYRQVHDLNLAE